MKSARRQSGQALVEFALTMPLFVMFVFVVIELALVFVAYYSETRMARETARYLAVHSRLTDDAASRPTSCLPASPPCVPSVLDHINQTMLPGLVGGTISAVTTDATTGDSVATVGNMHVQWTPCTWNGTVCTYAGQGTNPAGSARSAGSTLHVELWYDVSNLLFLPTNFRLGSLTVAMPTGLPKYRVSVMVE
jgi:Flp pilus assembly protein TadG